jgi:hypothetical protein
METVRFIEQPPRQPKNAVRLTSDRIQLSREWKIDDGTHIIIARPTKEPRMRFTILAAALFLAACQTQGDSTPTTSGGLTFATVEPDKRATLRAMIVDNRSCEANVAKTMPSANVEFARRGCECVTEAYVASVPEEIVDRHIAEARGTARTLAPWEIQNLAARVMGELRLAYARCGLRYD